MNRSTDLAGAHCSINTLDLGSEPGCWIAQISADRWGAAPGDEVGRSCSWRFHPCRREELFIIRPCRVPFQTGSLQGKLFSAFISRLLVDVTRYPSCCVNENFSRQNFASLARSRPLHIILSPSTFTPEHRSPDRSTS